MENVFGDQVAGLSALLLFPAQTLGLASLLVFCGLDLFPPVPFGGWWWEGVQEQLCCESLAQPLLPFQQLFSFLVVIR